MAVLRTDTLLCLALLLSIAEAQSLSDPITCYILDGVLLIYCIIFTALYFRVKFARMQSETPAPSERVYEALQTGQINDEYQTLDNPGGQASGPTRRNRVQEGEGQYEALRAPTNDEYQEIPKKIKPRKKSKKSGAVSHTAEVIEMEAVPSLPARS